MAFAYSPAYNLDDLKINCTPAIIGHLSIPHKLSINRFQKSVKNLEIRARPFMIGSYDDETSMDNHFLVP